MSRLGKIIAAKAAAEVIDEIGDARRHARKSQHQTHHHQNNIHKPMQNNMHPHNTHGVGRRVARAKIIKEILD